MVKSAAAAAVAAALISISCSDKTPTAPTQTTPTEAPSVRVAGRVIDYRTGQSVSGLTIGWRGGSDSHLVTRSLTSVTDANGRFEVTVPVIDGFAPLSDTDTLLFEIPMASGNLRIPAKALETELLVNPGQCAARYGYVYDAVTRMPIAGATVLRAGSATTDAQGYYRIDIGCEIRDAFYWGTGTTTVSVSHPSYQGAFTLDGRREGTSYSGIRRVDFALQPKS